MNIKIIYYSNINYLTKNEWIKLIVFYITTIKNTPTGNILLKEIEKFINQGNEVIIQNYLTSKSFQYPSFIIDKNKYIICIPDTPYFIKVPVLNYELIEGFKVHQDIKYIIKNIPLNAKLDTEFINSFSKYQFQPIVVVLFHELVHCLRALNNINSNTEEESTIYGIKNDTLIYNNLLITENRFRKDLKLSPRLSHGSQFYYVYGTNNNQVLSKETLKIFFRKII